MGLCVVGWRGGEGMAVVMGVGACFGHNVQPLDSRHGLIYIGIQYVKNVSPKKSNSRLFISNSGGGNSCYNFD